MKVFFAILILNSLSLVAQAKYTCSSLFVEKPSFEEQKKNILQKKYFEIVRDFPITSLDPTAIDLNSFEPGKEFLIRLNDLSRKLNIETAYNDFSTYNIDGIRHIAIRVLSVGPNSVQIEIPYANLAENKYLVYQKSFKSFTGYEVQKWDKQRFQYPAQVDGYKITRLSSTGELTQVSGIDFMIEGQQAEVEFSSTSYLLRQSHLSTVLFAKFLDEHRDIRRFKAELVAVNYAKFFEELYRQIFSEHIQYHEDKKEIYTSQLHAKLVKMTTDEKNRLCERAIRETPIYKSLVRWGFVEIEKIDLMSNSEDLYINFELAKKP